MEKKNAAAAAAAAAGGSGGAAAAVASAINISLQAGWQISVSAEVVRAVAFVFRLLTVTTSSGLSPARVVTSFIVGSF